MLKQMIDFLSKAHQHFFASQEDLAEFIDLIFVECAFAHHQLWVEETKKSKGEGRVQHKKKAVLHQLVSCFHQLGNTPLTLM